MMCTKTRLSVLLAVLALPLLSQAATDPVVGTWSLNVAKSDLGSGVPYKSQTREYAQTAEGIALTETDVLASGEKRVIRFTLREDGKASPVTGSPLYDSLVIKHVTATQVSSTLQMKGAVVGHAVREISKDGKTMSLESRIKGPDGREYKQKLVFDKQ